MVVLVVGVAFWQRYFIFDTIRLWNYQPSAAILQLANDTTMVASTKRTFYVYYPSLEDKSTFSKNCTSNEQTIVLGCYISGQGIFLYDVTDSRLRGVVEVTAAHEVLHAKYERLSNSEKMRVDQLITTAFEQVSDKRILDTIKAYRENGADVTNELHSILGTEVRNLPAELESYYAQYFSDRGAIVTYSEKYVQEFTSRRTQVSEYDEQLTSLKSEIDADQIELTSQAAAINKQYATLQVLKNSGQTEEYNAQVPDYNVAVNAYNTRVKGAQARIAQYNDLVAKRNALVIEEGELSEAIDSRPTTIQAQ